MDFEATYDLLGVRIRIRSDSFRIQQEADLFLGAHQTTQEREPDYRLWFEETPHLPDFEGPDLRRCTGQDHQIVEVGECLLLSVGEGVARYDGKTRSAHGYVLPPVNGRWHPEASVPLVNLLIPRIMFAAGWLPLHAAAVEWKGQMLILSGEKGAGKSTLALRLHQQGCPLLCDDLLYLIRSEGQLRGGGHCQPIKLKHAEATHWLRDGIPAPGRAGTAGKTLFPTTQFNPAGLNRNLPVAAVVALQPATERATDACVRRDRDPEVLYHLVGDSPLLNTPAFRDRALDVLGGVPQGVLLLAQTSHDVDQTVQTILRALE